MFDQRVIELAEKSADQAETFLHTGSMTPAEFQANKLKSLETKDSRSLTLRVIKDGRIGVTSTSRIDDPAAVVRDALVSAEFGAEARFEFPPLGERTEVDVFNSETPSFPVERMVETGRELISRLLDYNPDLLIDMSLEKEEEETRISRDGVAESYRRTGFGVSVNANLIRGTDMLDVFFLQRFMRTRDRIGFTVCGNQGQVGAGARIWIDRIRHDACRFLAGSVHADDWTGPGNGLQREDGRTGRLATGRQAW